MAGEGLDALMDKRKEGPKNPCANCPHGRRSHEVDYTNYPTRVEHGRCRVNGCPCTKYEWRGE